MSVPELCFKYVYPLLVFFVLKSKKEHFIESMLALSLYFSLLGHMKQVILFLYLFFFCKLFCFV